MVRNPDLAKHRSPWLALAGLVLALALAASSLVTTGCASPRTDAEEDPAAEPGLEELDDPIEIAEEPPTVDPTGGDENNARCPPCGATLFASSLDVDYAIVGAYAPLSPAMAVRFFDQANALIYEERFESAGPTGRVRLHGPLPGKYARAEVWFWDNQGHWIDAVTR